MGRHLLRNPKKGVAMTAFAITLLAMLGGIGLCFDVGRLYLTRNESQAFVDAGALAAAYELNGTSAGITAAQNAANRNWKRWDLGTASFSAPTVEFCANDIDWHSCAWASAGTVGNISHVRFVKVTSSQQMNAYVMPVITGQMQGTVRATAVAGQMQTTGFGPGGQTIPYFIFSRIPTPTPYPNPPDPTQDYGFKIGYSYAFQWGSNSGVDFDKWVNGNPAALNGWCDGDTDPTNLNNLKTIYLAAGSPKSTFLKDRGAFATPGQSTSASSLVSAVTYGYPAAIDVGEAVAVANSNAQDPGKALDDRVNADSDKTGVPSTTAPYAGYNGNGARVVLVPILNQEAAGVANLGSATVVDLRAFLLLPQGNGKAATPYEGGGTNPWCAIYLGNDVGGGGQHGAWGNAVFTIKLLL